MNITKSLKPGVNIIKIPVGGRIHNILYLCIMNGGTIPRTMIPGTQYSSKHIAQVELYDLARRSWDYGKGKSKGKLMYTITPNGENVYRLLQDALIEYLEVDPEEFKVECALGTKHAYVQLPPEVKLIFHHGTRSKEWITCTSGWNIPRDKSGKRKDGLKSIPNVEVTVNVSREAFMYHKDKGW